VPDPTTQNDNPTLEPRSLKYTTIRTKLQRDSNG